MQREPAADTEANGANISFFDGHSKWAKRQWLDR
jgi:prepilin-type processing-associated H-X9-DG protein